MQERDTPDRASSDTDRVRALEQRLSALEDRAEIAQLLASYGPSVDSGSAEETASLWTEAGTYTYSVMGDSPEQRTSHTLSGQSELVAMVSGAGHQGLIRGGSAHFIGAPHIRVDGDRAVAITYSMLILHDAAASRNELARVGSNEWQLVRTPEGWRVEARTQRLLDGRAESRELLSRAAGMPSI